MKTVKDYAARTATLIPDEGEILKDALQASLAEVTADAGITRVTIDLPKSEMNNHVPMLIQWGFKVHRQVPQTLTMLRVLR